jgi:hypothetical protein
MQHIIRKQVIDLSLAKGLDAFHIQQQVSNYYFAKIVPLLQEAFDAASTDDETISLDNLIIDLGIITEKEIEKGNWEEKVFKNITEQLIPVKHGISTVVKVIKKTRSLGISDQWIFYMQHGYLPWNVLQINQDWYDKVLEAFASDTVAISNLRNLINRHPDSVRRIVFQNSVSFLKPLVETLTAESQDALPQLIDELVKIISSSGKNKTHTFSSRQKKIKLWERALQLAASAETHLKPGKIADLLEKNSSDEDIIVVKQTTRIDKNEVDEEGIFVSNAGVVLLHPFLNFFFKNLNLIREEDFNDTRSQLKALFLLHYLATGNTKPEEHELVIAKVLCSWPLEEPVNNFIKLSKKELHEAGDLLLSVIQQWSILKGTSIDGLRETFLQRKGKLFTKNDNLALQIEQSSIDMLLDHLPWNLGIIKLPWMKDLLKVEWM